MSVATVAVLVAIENWTKWPLVEPSTQVTCGIDDKLPSQILPGYSEMGLFEKSVRSAVSYKCVKLKDKACAILVGFQRKQSLLRAS